MLIPLAHLYHSHFSISSLKTISFLHIFCYTTSFPSLTTDIFSFSLIIYFNLISFSTIYIFLTYPLIPILSNLSIPYSLTSTPTFHTILPPIPPHSLLKSFHSNILIPFHSFIPLSFDTPPSSRPIPLSPTPPPDIHLSYVGGTGSPLRSSGRSTLQGWKKI